MNPQAMAGPMIGPGGASPMMDMMAGGGMGMIPPPGVPPQQAAMGGASGLDPLLQLLLSLIIGQGQSQDQLGMAQPQSGSLFDAPMSP